MFYTKDLTDKGLSLQASHTRVPRPLVNTGRLKTGHVTWTLAHQWGSPEAEAALIRIQPGKSTFSHTFRCSGAQALRCSGDLNLLRADLIEAALKEVWPGIYEATRWWECIMNGVYLPHPDWIYLSQSHRGRGREADSEWVCSHPMFPSSICCH